MAKMTDLLIYGALAYGAYKLLGSSITSKDETTGAGYGSPVVYAQDQALKPALQAQIQNTDKIAIAKPKTQAQARTQLIKASVGKTITGTSGTVSKTIIGNKVPIATSSGFQQKMREAGLI